MNKEEILRRLNELKNNNAIVETRKGEKTLINIRPGCWEFKSAFGWLEADIEELTDELLSWDEKIIRIY